MGKSPDSPVVGARVTGELRQRYDAAQPEDMDDSPWLREVIEEGLDAREQSVYTQIGCEGELRATVEDLRRVPEQSREQIVLELLQEAVDARESDDTEKLADADLRDRVAALAEEGEPVDDVARRLLREAVDEEEEKEERSEIMYRIKFTVFMLILTGTPALFAYYGTANSAATVVIFFVLSFVFGKYIERFNDWAVSRFVNGIKKMKP